jgi:hypothetical protein
MAKPAGVAGRAPRAQPSRGPEEEGEKAGRKRTDGQVPLLGLRIEDTTKLMTVFHC